MKHLLNNISEEEKNRIREQHEGGMNLSIDNFKKLVETKLGDAKPYLSEQSSNAKQVAGPFSENQKESDIFKYYIFQDGSKFYIYMTDRTRKEPTLMDGSLWDNDGKGYPNQMEAKKKIDDQLKQGMHSWIKLREKPRMSAELGEQGIERMKLDDRPASKEGGMKIGPLNDNEIRDLAKQIVNCLDDEGKKLLFKLNHESKNHRPFFDMAMIEMGKFINSFGPKGPLG